MALSREYRALRKSCEVFTSGVDPESVVNKLYSKFLLTSEERLSALQKTLTKVQQLNEVYNSLEKRVTANPSDFHKVVEVLLKEPALEAVGKKCKVRAWIF